MKKLTICALISVCAIFPTNATEPPKDKRVVHTTWTGIERIDGSILMRSDINTRLKKSKNYTNTCTVGYIADPTDNKKNEFVPVLALPAIKNDAYVIKVVDEQLRVTTKNSGNMVATFYLRNLVPSLLAK